MFLGSEFLLSPTQNGRTKTCFYLMSALFHTFLEPCSGRSWPGRLSRHCCNGASRCMSSSPASTSVHRPYTFHIGASWAGKPLGRPKKRLTTPFAADSIIGKWRDHMLLRPKAVVSDDSGEDFFYIQAVCFLTIII